MKWVCSWIPLYKLMFWTCSGLEYEVLSTNYELSLQLRSWYKLMICTYSSDPKHNWLFQPKFEVLYISWWSEPAVEVLYISWWSDPAVEVFYISSWYELAVEVFYRSWWSEPAVEVLVYNFVYKGIYLGQDFPKKTHIHKNRLGFSYIPHIEKCQIKIFCVWVYEKIILSYWSLK